MFRTNLLLLLVVLVVSCKKEDFKVTTSTESLVKTKSEGNITESYTYDNQGRVTKITFTSNDNTPSYYHTFTYDGVTISEYHSEEPIYNAEQSQPNVTTQMKCTSNPRLLALNNNGFYKGGIMNCNEQFTYQYDANQFLNSSEQVMTDFNCNCTYNNDGKNITSIQSTGFSFGGGDFSYVTNYAYFSGKTNTIGNKNFGLLHLGKSSAELIMSEKKGKDVTNFSYEFDANQRVIKKTATINGHSTISTYSYY